MEQPSDADLDRGRRTGSLISAIFGLVYVQVNAGPLPAGAAVPLRIAGAVAFLMVLIVLVRDPGSDEASRTGAGAGFGSRYWAIVAGEVAALVVGLVLLNGPIGAPDAGVAWVSFVVGVHFLPLAALFGVRLFAVLGVAIAACGATGLVLAAAGVGEAPIAAVGGVVPGALLLAAGWSGARVRRPG